MPRYMSMIRIDEKSISGGPSPALMERMGKLMDTMSKAGVLLDTGGLAPTSQGTRVRWNKGVISQTDGPFTETKEVVGGYALLQARDRAEAVEWVKRFLEIHQNEFDLTCELREVEQG